MQQSLKKHNFYYFKLKDMIKLLKQSGETLKHPMSQRFRLGVVHFLLEMDFYASDASVVTQEFTEISRKKFPLFLNL